MKLFDEFSPSTAKDWEEKIIKDLKLKSLNELLWKTTEGLDILPFYMQEHLTEKNPPTIFTHSDWEIAPFIPSEHPEEELNEYILKSLNGGASGISITFFEDKNFDEIFNNISLPNIYTNINISFDAIRLLKKLEPTYTSINHFTQQKLCYIHLDPIFLFEKFGEWHIDKESDLSVLETLNHIPVNATLYKETGANVIQELFYTLAHLNEYLYFLEQKKTLHSFRHIHIQTSIGNSFFTEIAKLRALRILIQHLLKEYKHSAELYIHAQTSLINKSYLDLHNNLIRTTTESISAIFGGANAISILPYDYPFNKISDFSLRMSRNQLLIMKEESFLNKVADVSSGNPFVENYTQMLVEKAYQGFLEIEKKGGLIKLLENGEIQTILQQTFENELQHYMTNNALLIGVNKYPNPHQTTITEFYYNIHPTNAPKTLISKRYTETFEHQKSNV